jgi:hypothetical protein
MERAQDEKGRMRRGLALQQGMGNVKAMWNKESLYCADISHVSASKQEAFICTIAATMIGQQPACTYVVEGN